MGSCLSCRHHAFEKLAERFFEALGGGVARHPWATLFSCAVLVAGCCSGFFINFDVVTDVATLWTPSNTLSERHTMDVASGGFEFERSAMILLENMDESGSVLTKAAMDTLWQIKTQVVDKIKTEGNKTYADLCVKNVGEEECAHSFSSVTSFWGGSYDQYQATVTSDVGVLDAVDVDYFPSNEPVSLEAIFGNISKDGAGKMDSARAMLETWPLRFSSNPEDDTTSELQEWMGKFQDAMEDEAEGENDLKVYFFTSRSINDALKESITSEIRLFVATYVTMTIVAVLVVGRCVEDIVKRRFVLGLGGVILVITSALSGYSLCSALGVPLTTLASLLPFILIGIGVDDMFIIVSQFDSTDVTVAIERRVAESMKRCSLSITYTSMTNVAAFLLGSMSSLKGLEYFSYYAAASIFIDYILQMTAFVAFMTIDARRQEARRMDFFCCMRHEANRVIELSTPTMRGSRTRVHAVSCGELNRKDFAGAEELESHALGRSINRSANRGSTERRGTFHYGIFGKFMKDKYARFILSCPGAILVMLMAVVLLAAGLYGIKNLRLGFDLLDLAPDGHFAQAYKQSARSYGLDEAFVPFGVYTLDVDYPNTSVQAQIQETDALILGKSFTDDTHFNLWMSSFVTWAKNSSAYSANVDTFGGFDVYGDNETFYDALASFTEPDSNARFLSNIVFNTTGKIQISRSNMYLINMVDVTDYLDAILEMRSVVASSSLAPDVFTYTESFLLMEQYLTIYENLATTLLLALAAVAILSFVILGKIRISIVLTLTVAVIDLELLGFIHIWGLTLSPITVIELIMAVGLVVDYTVHVVHYIMSENENEGEGRKQRISEALGQIGPSVVLGASTTLLGIIPLAFAGNEVFRVFFRMFVVIIAFGFFHGMAFIPVLFSVLPKSWMYKPGSSTNFSRSRIE